MANLFHSYKGCSVSYWVVYLIFTIRCWQHFYLSQGIKQYYAFVERYFLCFHSDLTDVLIQYLIVWSQVSIEDGKVLHPANLVITHIVVDLFCLWIGITDYKNQTNNKHVAVSWVTAELAINHQLFIQATLFKTKQINFTFTFWVCLTWSSWPHWGRLHW